MSKMNADAWELCKGARRKVLKYERMRRTKNTRNKTNTKKIKNMKMLWNRHDADGGNDTNDNHKPNSLSQAVGGGRVQGIGYHYGRG